MNRLSRKEVQLILINLQAIIVLCSRMVKLALGNRIHSLDTAPTSKIVHSEFVVINYSYFAIVKTYM